MVTNANILSSAIFKGKICQKVYEINKKIKEHLINVMNKMENGLSTIIDWDLAKISE